MSSTARSEALLRHDDLPLPVEFRAIRSARRLRLRLAPDGKSLRLTGPLRIDRRHALAWAAEQSAWVLSQMEAMPAAEPFVPGALIPVEGRVVRLDWEEGASRAPRLLPDRLLCGGSRGSFARRIELFLKRHALAVLSEETQDIADAAGLQVRSVSVGDAATRWGSCSSDRRIRYSWRLILAPPEARRFVVAHEVAHLVHLNHGNAFKALERQLFGGDPRQARDLLREVGPRLKRIGRGG